MATTKGDKGNTEHDDDGGARRASGDEVLTGDSPGAMDGATAPDTDPNTSNDERYPAGNQSGGRDSDNG